MRGQALVEFGLVIGLIAVVALVAMTLLGTQISETLVRLGEALQ